MIIGYIRLKCDVSSLHSDAAVARQDLVSGDAMNPQPQRGTQCTTARTVLANLLVLCFSSIMFCRGVPQILNFLMAC